MLGSWPGFPNGLTRPFFDLFLGQTSLFSLEPLSQSYPEPVKRCEKAPACRTSQLPYVFPRKFPCEGATVVVSPLEVPLPGNAFKNQSSIFRSGAGVFPSEKEH